MVEQIIASLIVEVLKAIGTEALRRYRARYRGLMDQTALDAAGSDLEAAAAVFAALGNARRLAILRALPASTSELRASLMVEPLDDLRILERAGLVVRDAGVGPIRWRAIEDLAARVSALL